MTKNSVNARAVGRLSENPIRKPMMAEHRVNQSPEAQRVQRGRRPRRLPARMPRCENALLEQELDPQVEDVPGGDRRPRSSATAALRESRRCGRVDASRVDDWTLRKSSVAACPSLSRRHEALTLHGTAPRSPESDWTLDAAIRSRPQLRCRGLHEQILVVFSQSVTSIVRRRRGIGRRTTACNGVRLDRNALLEISDRPEPESARGCRSMRS
jgi:hypothetical protein